MSQAQGGSGVARPVDFSSILDRSDTPHLAWCRDSLQEPMSRQSFATRIDRSDIVAFILPSLGRRFALHHSYAAFAKLRLDKKPDSTPAADSAQVRCSRHAESLVTARALCRQVDRREGTGAALAVSVLCRSSAGGRQADGSRSDVAMSGVVDSGRQIGHGNIDANDPDTKCLKQLREASHRLNRLSRLRAG